MQKSSKKACRKLSQQPMNGRHVAHTLCTTSCQRPGRTPSLQWQHLEHPEKGGVVSAPSAKRMKVRRVVRVGWVVRWYCLWENHLQVIVHLTGQTKQGSTATKMPMVLADQFRRRSLSGRLDAGLGRGLFRLHHQTNGLDDPGRGFPLALQG